MPKCTSQNQRSLCKYSAWASTALQAKCLVMPQISSARYLRIRTKSESATQCTAPPPRPLIVSWLPAPRAEPQQKAASKTLTWQKKWWLTRRITSSYRLLRQCLHRLTRFRRAYCSYSSSKTVISTLDSYQTSNTTNISTFASCQTSSATNISTFVSYQHSVKCKHAINEISRQNHRGSLPVVLL
mgnify:CR=1 FL=1